MYVCICIYIYRYAYTRARARTHTHTHTSSSEYIAASAYSSPPQCCIPPSPIPRLLARLSGDALLLLILLLLWSPPPRGCPARPVNIMLSPFVQKGTIAG